MQMIIIWALAAGMPVANEPKHHEEPKNEAEKLFRKLEEKLNKAKTLECEFQFLFSRKDRKSFVGTLFLAEGNKARLEFNEVTGNRDHYLHIVFDGNYQSLREQGFDPLPYSPKNLNGDARIWMAHTGIFAAQAPMYDVKADNFKDRFRVSDFKLGKKEKIGERDTQRLEYKVFVKGNDVPGSSVLWLEIKTMLPVKRSLSFSQDGHEESITETYSKLFIDEKVDANKFELPKYGQARADDKEDKEDKKKLQGEWSLVSFELNGKSGKIPDAKYKFEGNKVYTTSTSGGDGDGTFAIDSSKKPKTIDLTGKGQLLKAIYELAGDTLKVCVGDSASERPTEFKSAEKVIVMTFKRVKK